MNPRPQFSLKTMLVAAVFVPPMLAAIWLFATWLGSGGGQSLASNPMPVVGYAVGVGVVAWVAVALACYFASHRRR